ncbi:hypothetical protein HDV00_007517 [Rhizophlyctis rosea]|nr:hypothetical protein HDV00_007517 [Rhizophlyctis rosea]
MTLRTASLSSADQLDSLAHGLLIAYIGLVRLLIEEDRKALDNALAKLTWSNFNIDTLKEEKYSKECDAQISPTFLDETNLGQSAPDTSLPSVSAVTTSTPPDIALESTSTTPKSPARSWKSFFTRKKDVSGTQFAHPALTSYDTWAAQTMEGVYEFHRVSEKERKLITDLPEHGVTITSMVASLRSTLLALANLDHQPPPSPPPSVASSTSSPSPPPSPSAPSSSKESSDPTSAAATSSAASTELATEILQHLILATLTPPSNSQAIELRYDARLRSLLRRLSFMIFDAALDVTDPGIDSAKDPEDSRNSDFAEREKLKGLLVVEAERGAAEKVWRGVEGVDVDGVGSGKKEKKGVSVGRWVGVGLATVGGGVVIGLTGGLAAPFLGAGIGTILTTMGVHATLAVGTTAGAAIVGSLFGVTGGGIAAYKVNNRLRGLTTFQFTPTHTPSSALSLTIPIAGWLSIREDAEDVWDFLPSFCPFSTISPLTFDPHILLALSSAYKALTLAGANVVVTEVLKLSILHGVISAVIWPVTLMKMSVLIDDPWSVGLERAKEAGEVMAKEVLLRGVQGKRPVTLVGFSLGARVIWFCLLELAREERRRRKEGNEKGGENGVYGVVDGVYMFGAPVTGTEEEWREVRGVCSGRVVVGYSRGDWLLGFLYRAAAVGQRVAGLGGAWVGGASVLREGKLQVDGNESTIGTEKATDSTSTPSTSTKPLSPTSADNERSQDESYVIENYDLTDLVSGHLKYKDMLPEILERVGFEKGWRSGVWKAKQSGGITSSAGGGGSESTADATEDEVVLLEDRAEEDRAECADVELQKPVDLTGNTIPQEREGEVKK